MKEPKPHVNKAALEAAKKAKENALNTHQIVKKDENRDSEKPKR